MATVAVTNARARPRIAPLSRARGTDSRLASPRKTLSTLRDLLEHLGDIPADRVRLQPPPGTARPSDVLRIHAREKRLCEIVDGVLVEKPIGYLESHIAAELMRWVGNFNHQHDLGVVAGEAGMLRLGRGLVRIPDVSFVSWNRLPGRRFPRQPIPKLVPDLAVEVLSEGNTAREMARKLDDYFRAGVRLVWIIDPKTKTTKVYEAPDRCVVVGKNDTLTGGEVLPGFKLPIRKLFERAAR